MNLIAEISSGKKKLQTAVELAVCTVVVTIGVPYLIFRAYADDAIIVLKRNPPTLKLRRTGKPRRSGRGIFAALED